MKTTKALLIAIIALATITGCSISDLASSKIVNKTADKMVNRTIYGNYKWSDDNLNVSTFRNGDPIPEVKSDEEWVQAAVDGKPAWCYLNNDSSNEKKYGKLYNWYAVSDPRGLAPEGYRIPTEEDFDKLIESTGISAANHIKKELIKGGSTGFDSKLGGYRSEDGYFHQAGETSRYWTNELNPTTPDKSGHALYIGGRSNMSGTSSYRVANGFSVRCIKE
jgi:uncharacterized protein (TIGR02145 family)